MEHFTQMSAHQPGRHERQFAAVPGSPKAARDFVAGVLAGERAAPAVIADFRLIVSELVANAVQHGGQMVVVEVRTDDPSRFEVRVSGGRLPDRFSDPAQWRINDPEAAGGRGLGIVKDRMRDVRVTHDERGSAVVVCWSSRS